MIDFGLSLAATYAKQEYPELLDFMRGLTDCNTQHIGVFARIQHLDYDHPIEPIDDDLLRSFSEGVQLEPNDYMHEMLHKLECKYFESMGMTCSDTFSMTKTILDQFF